MNADTRPSPIPPAVVIDVPVRGASKVLFALVVALVVWTPLPFGSVEPWSIGIIRVSVCLLVAVWAVHSARNGTYDFSASLLQAPLYGAAAWAFIQSKTVSVDPFLSEQAAVMLFVMAVFVSMALVAVDSSSRIETAALVLFWFGFGLCVFAIVQSLTGTRSLYWLTPSPVVNFFGPFVNKNHFAGLAEILIPLGLGPLVTGAVPRDRRLMTIFVAAVMLMAVLLSRSRGGMLAVAAQVVLLIGLGVLTRKVAGGRSRQTPALASVAAVVLLMCLGVMWLGAGPVTESIASLPADAVEQSETSRREIWKATVSLIESRPLTGSGLGAYGQAILPHWPTTEYSVLLYAHNDYLQVLADAGIPGALLAILFVVVLAAAFARSLRIVDPGLRGAAIGAGVGCIGLLIHSVVDFNLQIPSNAIAFLFASVLLVRAAAIGVPRAGRA